MPRAVTSCAQEFDNQRVRMIRMMTMERLALATTFLAPVGFDESPASYSFLQNEPRSTFERICQSPCFLWRMLVLVTVINEPFPFAFADRITLCSLALAMEHNAVAVLHLPFSVVFRRRMPHGSTDSARAAAFQQSQPGQAVTSPRPTVTWPT